MLSAETSFEIHPKIMEQHLFLNPLPQIRNFQNKFNK